MTLSYVARRLHLSVSQLSRIETGARRISSDYLGLMCDCFRLEESSSKLLNEWLTVAEMEPGDDVDRRHELQRVATEVREYAIPYLPPYVGDRPEDRELQTSAASMSEIFRQHEARKFRYNESLQRGETRFSILIDESTVLRDQHGERRSRLTEQLLFLAEMVDMRIIPLAASAAAPTAFTLFRINSPSGPISVVRWPGVQGDSFSYDDTVVAAYAEWYYYLRESALSVEDTRQWLLLHHARVREQW